jgi:hypothetical protein
MDKIENAFAVFDNSSDDEDNGQMQAHDEPLAHLQLLKRSLSRPDQKQSTDENNSNISQDNNQEALKSKKLKLMTPQERSKAVVGEITVTDEHLQSVDKEYQAPAQEIVPSTTGANTADKPNAPLIVSHQVFFL